MSILTIRTVGNVPARCSVYRVACLALSATSFSAPKLIKAVNSVKVDVAGNTHLGYCCDPGFLQSDSRYDDLVDTLHEYALKRGNPLVAQMMTNEELDRYDAVVPKLAATIDKLRNMNKNNAHYVAEAAIAQVLQCSEDLIAEMEKGMRAVPLVFAREVAAISANLSGTPSDLVLAESIGRTNKAHVPVSRHLRGFVFRRLALQLKAA